MMPRGLKPTLVTHRFATSECFFTVDRTSWHWWILLNGCRGMGSDYFLQILFTVAIGIGCMEIPRANWQFSLFWWFFPRKSMQNPRDLRAPVWLETCLVRKNACPCNHDASNKKSWTLHFLGWVCVFGSLPRWPKKNLDEKILCICQTSHFFGFHVEFRRYYIHVDVYVCEYTCVHEYTCVYEYRYV